VNIVSRASSDRRRRTLLGVLGQHAILSLGISKAPPGVFPDLRPLRVAGLLDVRQAAQRHTYGHGRPLGRTIAAPRPNIRARATYAPGPGDICARSRRHKRPLGRTLAPARPNIRRPQRLADMDAWIGGARASWRSRLDTLHIEIANERKTR
jgi:hypothetical protein